MVDYTIYRKTDKNTWLGNHHVQNAKRVPNMGEYITFFKDGIITGGLRVIDVHNDIEFKTSGSLEIGKPKGIGVYVRGTTGSFIEGIERIFKKFL